MNRRTLATIILAGAVIAGTSGASGGCGGSGDDRGVSAPHVGDGGEQSAPKEEHSSEEKTPNPSHDAQPRKSPSDKRSEESSKGHDPCINSFGEPGHEITMKGQNLEAEISIGPCDPEPKQYGGVLQFAYTPDNPPGQWVPIASVPVYGTSGTTKTLTTCKDGWWVVVFTSEGRDSDGNDFKHPYSSLPRDITCPAKH
jgi:hypothetical protein